MMEEGKGKSWKGDTISTKPLSCFSSVRPGECWESTAKQAAPLSSVFFPVYHSQQPYSSMYVTYALESMPSISKNEHNDQSPIYERQGDEVCSFIFIKLRCYLQFMCGTTKQNVAVDSFKPGFLGYGIHFQQQRKRESATLHVSLTYLGYRQNDIRERWMFLEDYVTLNDSVRYQR